ncbi:MAG TPA: ABC transporter ATP-binding protein [Negativicutes bacterium]|nr:ABC transporter ATP-binding protein [Negativicutes bacterium]
MTQDNLEINRKAIVEVEHLCTWFPVKREITDVIGRKPVKYVKAVNDVSLCVYKGENLGLVGESGCGKSTLAKTIIRLHQPNSGSIRVNGTDITHMKGSELRGIRPNMQMIFQDPYSSLNPRMTIYEIIEEMLKVHHVVPRDQVEGRVYELLEMCGLSRELSVRYPGEFSGGQRQRVGIARALSLNPSLVIADEPVSALDVSIQAQIINLLSELQKRLNLTILFISHDLRVIRYITQRTAVMYLGNIVEMGKTEELFKTPLHPYTDILLKASPKLDPTRRSKDYAIQGEVPSPIDVPEGCLFHPRCPRCTDRCKLKQPELLEVSPGHFAACYLYENDR